MTNEVTKREIDFNTATEDQIGCAFGYAGLDDRYGYELPKKRMITLLQKYGFRAVCVWTGNGFHGERFVTAVR